MPDGVKPGVTEGTPGYGMQAYADLMNHFAAGERSINRVE